MLIGHRTGIRRLIVNVSDRRQDERTYTGRVLRCPPIANDECTAKPTTDS
jgi:hypothetical protein